MRVYASCLLMSIVTLSLVGCNVMEDGGSGSSGSTTPTSGTASVYTISGTVSGAGSSGTLLTLSGTSSATATADSNGAYQFQNLANGSYTVTPSRRGYTFSPTSRTLTISGGNLTAGSFTSSFVTVLSSSSGTPDRIMFLQSDSSIRGSGRNHTGQMGDGTSVDRLSPVQTLVSVGGAAFSDLIAIAGSDRHTLALKSNGTVWAWGANLSGPLGDGTETPSYVPLQVQASAGTPLTGVISVSAGSIHSLALLSNGTVLAWGDNSQGQLGDAEAVGPKSLYPQLIPGLTSVAAIAASEYHSLALLNNGTVWAWGNNDYGQLGDNSTTKRTAPVQVSGLTGVIAITTGPSHSMALLNDGTVKTWGSNTYGQLGDGTTTARLTPVVVTGLSRVTKIAAGQHHSLALLNNGTVFSWGDNLRGQLGDGANTATNTAAVISSLAGITSIGAGSNHSFAIRNDNTVLVWGHNNYGQFGTGTTPSESNTPVESGF